VRLAYFTYSNYDGRVSTIAINDMVNVDLDDKGELFGVEVIDFAFFEQATEELSQFGLSDSDVETMRKWLNSSALPAA
jgi:uncharacterized protein YuzE